MQKIGGLIVIAAVVAVAAASWKTNPGSTPQNDVPPEAFVPVGGGAETAEPFNNHLLAERKGETNMFASKNSNSVQHASDADFQQKVLGSAEPVLVDFYADWCGPCRMLGPVLEELASEQPTVRIVKVNVDHSPQLAQQYGIESIPALMVFQNGRVVGRHVGLANKAKLQSMLGL